MRRTSISQIRTHPLHEAWRRAGPALGLAFAYSCGHNLLLLAPPLFLLQIYDRVLSSRSMDTLVMLALIVAFAVMVGSLLDALRRIALGRIGGWLEDRLRPPLLAATLDSGDPRLAGRAAAAYRDAGMLRQFLGSGACPLLFDVVWAPLFLILLFLVHPLLGAIGALSAVVVFGAALAGETVAGDSAARAAEGYARAAARLAAAAPQLSALRAAGTARLAARLAMDEAASAAQDREDARRRAEIMLLLTTPFRGVAQIAVMAVAAGLVLHEDRSPAIIFASSLLFGRCLAPLQGLATSWKALDAALASYRRIADVLAWSVGTAASRSTDLHLSLREPGDAKGRLLVENVRFAPPGAARSVLRDVSFDLAPGECLGVIGLSGSGKSMLSQLVAGVHAPDHGQILLEDPDPSCLPAADGARCVGYLPQEVDLVGGSLRQVISGQDDPDLDDVVEAARLVGLHETIARLPDGYDTDAVHGGLILLRGHRQRLGLARAFFGRPRLVVLDEPNACLDCVGERILAEAIARIKAANGMVVVTTHRTGLLAVTDKILILNHGAVSAYGPTREVSDHYLSPQPVGRRVARTPGESHDALPRRPGGLRRARPGWGGEDIGEKGSPS
ncbi:type I secretion system permease/ATPase [Alsobacter sp. SYSU BS001988]